MSSTMKVPVSKTRASKTMVIAKKSKSVMGTTKLPSKRRKMSEDKRTEPDVDVNPNILSETQIIDQDSLRLQELSKDNNRKQVLNEKNRQQINVVADKKERDETPSILPTNDSVTSENKTICEGSNKEKRLNVDKLPSTNTKVCKVEHGNNNKAIPRYSTRLKTTKVGIPETSTGKSKEVCVKHDISFNADNLGDSVTLSRETFLCETTSELSIPKANTVITDSCVRDQTGFILSDANKDTIYTSDTPEQTLSVFSKENKTDEKQIFRKTTENIPDNATKNTKIGAKNKIKSTSESHTARSLVPKSIPNYQRTTSSSANKEAKKITSETQSGTSKIRPESQGGHHDTSDNPNSKSPLHRAKTSAKPVQKDWQSGLRSCDSSTKSRQKTVPDSIKNNASLNSRSRTDNKILANEKSSNNTSSSTVGSESEIKIIGNVKKSRSRSKSLSPSESVIIQKKKTDSAINSKDKLPNKGNNVLKNDEPLKSELSDSVSSETGTLQNYNATLESNLKQTKLDRSKILTQSSQSHSKSDVPTSVGRKSFQKPSQLTLRRENLKRPNGSNFRLSTPADSKLLSPRLKRKDSKTDLDSLSLSASLGDTSIRSCDSQGNSSPSEKSTSHTNDDFTKQSYSSDTCSGLERQTRQQCAKTEINSRREAVSGKSKPENQKTDQEGHKNSKLPQQSVRSGAINRSSGRSASKVTMKGQKPDTSQNIKKLNRDSNSRSRSITPAASPTSSNSNTLAELTYKQTLLTKKQENDKTKTTDTKDSDSRLRLRRTCGTSNSSSSNNAVSSKVSVKVTNYKQVSPRALQDHSRDSRSRSATPGASSSSSTSDRSSDKTVKPSTLDSKQKKLETIQKTSRDSRSRSTTPGSSSSCSDPGAKLISKETSAVLKPKITQSNKNIKKETNSKPQQTKLVGATNISVKHNVGQRCISESVMKRQTSQTSIKSSGSNKQSKKVQSSADVVKSTAKQTALNCKETNRDTNSRSRSSTPSLRSVSSSTGSDSENSFCKKTAHKRSKMTNETNSKTSNDLSVMTVMKSHSKSLLPAYQTQRKRVGLVLSKSSASVTTRVSTGYRTGSIKTNRNPLTVLKTKNAPENERNTHLDNSSCLQGKSTDTPIPVKVTSTKSYQVNVTQKSRKSNTSQSSATKANLQKKSLKSCNSLTTPEDTRTPIEENSHLSESQNICNYTTQIIPMGSSDKPMLKSTKLSIKAGSSINAGKISISERNKKIDKMQTSTENKGCAQTGITNTEKKANKTFVSDSKSRKTASLSAIKRDSVSTQSRYKDEKIKSYKQKPNLPENVKFGVVNIERGTEYLSTDNDLHSVSLTSDMISSSDELVSSSEQDSFISSETSVKDFENTEIAQRHNTVDVTCDLISENLDKNYQETDTQFVDTSKTVLRIDRVYQEENACYEKNEEKQYKQNDLEEYTISTNVVPSNISFTDRKLTVCDPNSKVNNNCLWDIVENEKQHGNEEITVDTGFLNTNKDFINDNEYCSNREGLSDYESKLEKTFNGNDSDTSENLKDRTNSCDNNKHNEMSLQCMDDEDVILCIKCKELLENYSICNIYKHAKNVGVKSKCKNCDKDVLTGYKPIKSNSTLEESVLEFSPNFKCQTDKRTETQIFEIDTCDVNSSHKVPITEGCALEHTEFTDSQADKFKCTDAVPVTGAVSLQITNKRQDKKISSLSTRGKRNTEFLCNRNGFVQFGDGRFDVVDVNGSNAGVQKVGSIECRQKLCDASSKNDNDYRHLDASETKSELKDSKYYNGSSAIEQSVSDWQTFEIYDRLCSENMANLQVMNNGEINKETFEPEHCYGKVKEGDSTCCDKTQNINYTEMDIKRIHGDHITGDTGGTTRDLYSEITSETLNDIKVKTQTTVQNILSTVSSQNLSRMESKVCDVFLESDKLMSNNGNNNLLEEEDGQVCVPTNEHSVCHDNSALLESSQNYLQYSFTCGLQKDENICKEHKTSLPEQTSQTIGVKSINIEQDLSFHASSTSDNKIQNTSELDHTRAPLIKHSRPCECKQNQSDNDKSIETASVCKDNNISGSLPQKSVLQNQLLRIKPDGVFTESNDQGDTSNTPYVLKVQEKQTNCLDYGDDSESLFSQRAITEDGVCMATCKFVNKSLKSQHRLTVDKKSHCLQHEQNNAFVKKHISRVSDVIINNQGMQKHDESSIFQNDSNHLFPKVPKLSEYIHKMYPNLKPRDVSSEEETNYENLQCSNMTQTANMNNCSLSMKLNDSACLFQHYKQSGKDDINVSPECKYCTGLSQDSKDISKGISKKLHSQHESNEESCTEQGSLEIKENYLFAGSLPGDGENFQINTLINQKISSEYRELNGLSQFFDDREDTDSCEIMSCDQARASTESNEYSSELSADLTDCEALKNYYHASNQDGFEDKPSDLSSVKITTQKSSCNLMLSEKPSEPQDFVFRYESKNSASHKKFYSCTDEPDTCIARTQEENNFRNLAANRDEDINFEIKLNNLNIETPTHCDASLQESKCLNTKISSYQGQYSGKVQASSSAEVLNESFDLVKKEGFEILVHLDNVEQEVEVCGDGQVLNGDNRFSSINPEHGSDKDSRDNRNLGNSFLQEYSIKTHSRQTEENKNCILPLHEEEELHSTSFLPETLNHSVSCVIKADNKNEIQSHISGNSHSDDIVGFTGESHSKADISCVKNTISDAECNNLDNNNDKKIDDTALESLERQDVETGTHGRNNICSHLDETLSDTSEVYTDADDRVNSPYLDKTLTKSEDSAASGKDSNISCRDSTSTESFVDAVESLDDDYLTSVYFRRSKELQNEESVSQTPSVSDDSTTNVGSMEDLSGWEEFSENITDINDYSCEMEAKRYDVTNIDRNFFHNIPDGQTHAPLCRTTHVLHDKIYQSPSPTSEPNEIYPSLIKPNTLRYKDMRYDAEQKVIGNSIFETGNGGALETINDKGVKGETRINSDTKLQDDFSAKQNYQSVTILHGDNNRQTDFQDKTKTVENNLEQAMSYSNVDSKIEMAVIKRTQRRRRRQVEQLKGNDWIISETGMTQDEKREQDPDKCSQNIICDNNSIDKTRSTHSEHFMYACTVSDNITFNNEPASGTQVLSEEVNTNLNLNEFKLDRSTYTGTPLNYDYEDCVTKEVSLEKDKADMTCCKLKSWKNERSLKDSGKQSDEIKRITENDNLELIIKGDICCDSSDDNVCRNVEKSVHISEQNSEKNQTETEFENDTQVTIELPGDVQKKDVEFDDIQFIDADDSTSDIIQNVNFESERKCKQKDSENVYKQDTQISPNVSFTFMFEEDRKDGNAKLSCKAQESTAIQEKTCRKSEKADTIEESSEQIKGNHNNSPDITDELVTQQKEANCETNDINTTITASLKSEQSKFDECYTNNVELRNSLSLKVTNSFNDMSEDKTEITEDTMHTEICQESNISVRHALEIEKQKLANNDGIRSRKCLFISKRNERRATIDNSILKDKGSAEWASESRSNSETAARNTVRKSQSFRSDRKQISPMASFMNPQEMMDESDNKEPSEIVSKKVSDICKSFMTKTKASVQRSRAQSSSKSPAPQRKLMKWVNNQGKWMRVPIDETMENRLVSNRISKEHLHLSERNDDNMQLSPKTIINTDEIQRGDKTFANIDNSKHNVQTVEKRAKSPLEDLKSDNYMTINLTEIVDTVSTNEQLIVESIVQSCLSNDGVPLTVENDIAYSKASEVDRNGHFCFQKQDTNNDIGGRTSTATSAENQDIHVQQEDKQTIDDTICTSAIVETECPQTDSVASRTTISRDGNNEIDLDYENTETSLPACESELDVKVIGTTLNDDLCDQEKHLKRQELLFGLLDSFNRRKPRRITQTESATSMQNISKSVSENKVQNTSNIDSIGTSMENATCNEKQEKSLETLKGIPKIKAVKIQEEIFECKREYLKDTNICSSSNVHGSISTKTSAASKRTKDEKIPEKSLKQAIRKSKTFAGFEDIDRQKRLTHEYNNCSDERETSLLSTVTQKHCEGDVSLNKGSNDDHSKVTLTSKRAKAGLRLNLEKALRSAASAFHLDKSPSRQESHKHRGRSQGDKSPNRLSVEQPRMRVRSPDKGPRQIQRSKLLSEIVEVEESKEDNSVTCDPGQARGQYPDRQRQEAQKPVKRSNKRRSLSLPTGTLAFGEARIVYKNGHFTIETMDPSEYEALPSECHSSSSNLDSQDDLWDTSDNQGVKSDSREITDLNNKRLMRRQNAKTTLKSSDSTEDVFYNETDLIENVTLYRSNLNGESQVLNMGRTNAEDFNESCSSRTSDMSVDSYSSVGMDVSTDDSVTESKKLSSSSLPESNDEVKLVMQRAKRTSSFRAAQEAGALRLSGIEEDKVHNSARARSVSLDDGQNSDSSKSPKIQSVQNQNPTFLKKVMAKRKGVNENISGFSKQSESAKEFFTKKMTLKGLFRKNKSDSSMNSPLKTEHPVSPPIATFQDDDIGSVDTPPSSPYRTRDLRRRHTSADILKMYPDSSETDSNCPTPTQERSSICSSRNSVSTPSTPSHEGNMFMNLSSRSAPPFRDEDEMSITSASSFASSIHSPPSEQPHKPKTPKPVGASPRRNPSFSSAISRSGSQSSQRNVLNSVTSLESDHFDSFHDDVLKDSRCECSYEMLHHRPRVSSRNIKGSADSLSMCQFCKQREFYKSDSAFASSFHKQQLSGGEKDIDDSAKLRRDSSGRSNFDRLGIISQTDVASSNSNDSGIQRDSSLHSSNESVKGTPESRVRLRRNKSLSPHPDRPKSEVGVKWADEDTGDYDISETSVKLRHRNLRDRPRPKSDLDGSSFLSGRMKAFGSEVNLQPYCSLRSLYEIKRHDMDRQKNRRMSTPHPIKSRLQRAPHKLQKQPPLVRSSSMPESLEKIHKRRKMHHLLDFHLDSLSRHMDIDDMSDESDLSFDQASLQERSVSVQSSTSQLTAMDEDEDNLTYAEALWDHITMDPEELGFRAQDVIEVLDMADKDWWFGVIDDREGWFPATFVRIRVNQDQLDDDLDLDSTIQDNLTTSPKLRRISMFNKNQARSNVVNEIINAEREYVKHLKDVVEGYIQHARKRIEMFPEERILLIFGNIETIYGFAKKFLSQLETCIDVCPHLSEIGQCFLENERGFEIYSDYCNNHPSACEELDELCKDSKYKHFFEAANLPTKTTIGKTKNGLLETGGLCLQACRLLQELVEIPLEGFLLTPVQKICKYPLQLAELLKYTPPDHADYMMVKDALAAMRKIATLINERKRKMESIEKIAVWQHSVVDWEGPDLLERSSELIFSGELNKVNTAGWSQERFFFLFDHQVVYCKKELLKRHVFSYKGRIDLDHCDIVDIPDGKDSQYNVTVKYAWKFHETHKDKWYLVYAKSEAVKQHWLKAIKSERQRVLEDQENDFCVPDHWKQTVLNKVRSQSHIKDKHSGGRGSQGQLMLHKDLKDFTYSTLPRHRHSQKHDKKKGWFKFVGGKKTKR